MTKNTNKDSKKAPSTDHHQKSHDSILSRTNSLQSSPNLPSYYPHRFHSTSTIADLHLQYPYLHPSETIPSFHSITGRILSKRGHGKLYFYQINSHHNNTSSHSTSTKIQIMFNAKFFQPSTQFQTFKEANHFLQRGDIIGVSGNICKTNSGELSLNTTSITVLAPCLSPLPSTYYSIKEVETRFRQRYLDLIMNENSKESFIIRSKVIRNLRNNLEDKGFLEVETPVLSGQAGGAAARPFNTYLNDLKMPLSLRIAPELYLKQLIIGGFEKVFEIGKSFRNEGIDATHNPEFTTMELYWAYKCYRDGMALTEEILSSMAMEIKGKLKFEYNGKEVNFQRPFKALNYLEAIETESGVVIPEDIESEETRGHLESECRRLGVKVPSPPTTAKLLDKLCSHFVEPKLISPTFLIEQPQIMSPLAKFHRSKKGLTERFELFVCGFEVANAYTELNMPGVQREMFEKQNKDREEGDDEIPPTDEDFIRAMEYGMPPTCGIGIGIDRMAMIFSNNTSIKEVILFPLMREKEKKNKEEKEIEGDDKEEENK